MGNNVFTISTYSSVSHGVNKNNFFSSIPILNQLEMYKWCAIGIALYITFYRWKGDKMSFIETDTHEHLHIWTAVLFNRKVHSLHAEQQSGVVYTSGTHTWTEIPVSLAPYCVPIFSFILLAFRWLLNFHGKWLFDILIGISLGFHYCCVKSQIGSHQTDINQYPLPFSYSYITTIWLINICLIMAAFFPNMNPGASNPSIYGTYGIFSSIYRWGASMWDNLIDFINFIV